MTRIELSQDEARVLNKILESYLAELKIEITGTSVDDFVEVLQREQTLLENLLERLQSIDLGLPESMAGDYD